MANLKPECAPVQDIVTGQFRRPGKVRILEAGCGSNSAFTFQDNAYIVGLDISDRQLQLNTILDEKHCGDLQDFSFPAGSFDMIICWNVLEHLPRPEQALENFASWVAPGGIIVLALPNIRSTIGLATKFTPHWFHIWWYRVVCRSKNAGKDGRGPFQTYLRGSLALPRLLRFAREHGLNVLFSRLYGHHGLKGKGRSIRLLFKLATWPVEMLSLGRISAFNECVMVVLGKTESE